MARVGCKVLIAKLLIVLPFGVDNWPLVGKTVVYRLRKDYTLVFGTVQNHVTLTNKIMYVEQGSQWIAYTKDRITVSGSYELHLWLGDDGYYNLEMRHDGMTVEDFAKDDYLHNTLFHMKHVITG